MAVPYSLFHCIGLGVDLAQWFKTKLIDEIQLVIMPEEREANISLRYFEFPDISSVLELRDKFHPTCKVYMRQVGRTEGHDGAATGVIRPNTQLTEAGWKRKAQHYLELGADGIAMHTPPPSLL